MKYRIRVYEDMEGCYDIDCKEYLLEQRKTFLFIPYWTLMRKYYYNQRDEAYKKLDELNLKS